MALEKIILQKGDKSAETYTKAAIDTLLSGKQAAGSYQPAGSYADLVNGKVPTDQLPSYVDDVLEYDSDSAFPSTGEAGKIYIDKSTNKTYRWGGTRYVEISASLAIGDQVGMAYAGNKGAKNAADIAALQTTVTGKADKSDTYTKSQVDTSISNAVAGMVPSQKVLTTYTAYYTISDGQIEIYLKNQNGTAAKEFKITPTSILWNNQTIATTDQIPDVSGKADKSDTYTKSQVDASLSLAVPRTKAMASYVSHYEITDGNIYIYLQNTNGTASKQFQITPTSILWNNQTIATTDQIPDISGKADHTTVATSSDGKTITFTFN